MILDGKNEAQKIREEKEKQKELELGLEENAIFN